MIRDPLTVNENGELVCVGQVEENTLVSIMKGNKDSLIIAAEEAAIESMKKANQPQKGHYCRLHITYFISRGKI